MSFSQPISQIPRKLSRSCSISRLDTDKNNVDTKVKNLENAAKNSENNKGEKHKAENKKHSNTEDKLDKLTDLIVGLGTTMSTHIQKYDADIAEINNKLSQIEENSRRITRNEENIVEVKEDIQLIRTTVTNLEDEVHAEFSRVAECTTSMNTEINSRTTRDEVDLMIKGKHQQRSSPSSRDCSQYS